MEADGIVKASKKKTRNRIMVMKANKIALIHSIMVDPFFTVCASRSSLRRKGELEFN
jgi:hypothetical protein